MYDQPERQWSSYSGLYMFIVVMVRHTLAVLLHGGAQRRKLVSAKDAQSSAQVFCVCRRGCQRVSM